MTIQYIIEEARKRSGINQEVRLAAARTRSEEMNKNIAREWEELKVTPKLLNKVMNL